MVHIDNIAFDPPGGEGNEISTARPLNLSHLNRQTLGDRDLEQEILAMFCHQSAELADLLVKTTGAERKKVAHKLKGAARAVGAFNVADCAGRIEADPQNETALKKLVHHVGEARDYISSICR
jgi:HPt (histidine-containing phosphotransfer) domain-containing protein